MSLVTDTVTVTVLTAWRTALLTSSETTSDAYSHAEGPHSPTATAVIFRETRTRATVGANVNVITDRSELGTDETIACAFPAFR